MAQPPDKPSRVSGAIRRIENAGEALACIALWGIVVVLFLQMIFRAFLQTGLSWPDELARYLHIVVVFLAAGAVARRDGHIRVTLLSSRLRGAAIRHLRAIAELVAPLVIALGAAEIMTRLGGFQTPALAMPLALFFLPAAAGFALVSAEAVRRWMTVTGDGREDAASGAP